MLIPSTLFSADIDNTYNDNEVDSSDVYTETADPVGMWCLSFVSLFVSKRLAKNTTGNSVSAYWDTTAFLNSSYQWDNFRANVFL